MRNGKYLPNKPHKQLDRLWADLWRLSFYVAASGRSIENNFYRNTAIRRAKPRYRFKLLKRVQLYIVEKIFANKVVPAVIATRFEKGSR